MDHHTSKFTQGLNMPVLAVIAVVGTLVVWVSVVGTQAYYETGVRLEEQVKIIQPDYLASKEALTELRQEQLANLAHIADAKRAVVAQYGRAAPAGASPAASDREPSSPGHH